MNVLSGVEYCLSSYHNALNEPPRMPLSLLRPSDITNFLLIVGGIYHNAIPEKIPVRNHYYRIERVVLSSSPSRRQMVVIETSAVPLRS